MSKKELVKDYVSSEVKLFKKFVKTFLLGLFISITGGIVVGYLSSSLESGFVFFVFVFIIALFKLMIMAFKNHKAGKEKKRKLSQGLLGEEFRITSYNVCYTKLLRAKQTEMLGGKIEPAQIFPEYYVIKVNQFDDIAKDTLDQWIYYLKNNEIKDDFTAKGICQARELWRVDTLPEEEQKNYSLHLKNLRNEASRILTLKVDAEDRVRLDEKRQVAKGLKAKNIPVEIIMETTGLSREEIETL